MAEDQEYQEFRRRYEARHPASVPKRRRIASDFPRWLQTATFIMFLCSALLSGVHTVPVVRAGIPGSVPPLIADVVSGTAFVSVEIAILLSSYAMIGGGGIFVGGVLALATLTALTANIYSVVRAYQMTAGEGETGTLVVAIIIGIVAPGIAFLSGRMYVNMSRSDRRAQERVDAEYTRAAQEWDARIEREWTRYAGDVRPDVQSDGDRTGRRTLSVNAAAVVREHLQDHPEDLSMSVRDLAQKLGVGKSTVSVVRTEFGGVRQGNNNGTH